MSIALPESSPSTGELLDGRYLLDSRLGAGGMAVVYRARDESLGRTVAVKVFRGSAMDAARTASETRLLASLNHHALVTLYDARISSDTPSSETPVDYLVMELVDGPTLRQRLAEGPLSAREVAVMARELAEALHVVHQAGIVHRDIKPSNVLLRRSLVPGEEYRAKLADFGIAYLIDSTRITTPGTLIGTAAYLSPEQVQGATPVPAGDVYSLGLVLLESLTGRPAFSSETASGAALARLTRDPEIPGSLGYGWKSLLSAMTARDPARRPSALDVVVAAERIARGDLDEPDATGALDLEEARTADARTERLTPGGADVPTGKVTPAPADEPTETALTITGITKLLPAEEGAAEATADDAPPTRRQAAARRATRIRPWIVVVAVVALLVVAAIVWISLAALGSTAADQAPTLPTLEQPLGDHMQQLLDSVQP